MKSPITFAKIVATPTLNNWSQAYNAGNFAAVISLTQEPIENSEEKTFEENLSLQVIGKELLNTLEAEYFTIEAKNLNSIKQAIATTVEKAPSPILVSLGVSVIIENVLYVFQYGSGKILLKRKQKLGTLLEQSEEKKISAASGYIEDNDIVLLETANFAKVVSTDVLLPCLEENKLITITEVLSPIIHKEGNGAASAIAFLYQEEGSTKIDVAGEDESETLAEEAVAKEEENVPVDETPRVSTRKGTKKFPALPFSHSRRLFLTIGIVIIIVLVTSIFFSMKRQQDQAIQKLYETTVVPAQKKYDEGESLLALNKNVAKEDFQTAKNILDDAKNRFPSNSSQEKQILDLLQKVSVGLSLSAQVNLSSAKQVDATNSSLLSTYSNHSDALYAAIDGTSIYVANNTAITLAGGKDKVAVKNNSDWKSIGGFGIYLGNFYLLDKNDGIIKYAGELQSGKAVYFTGTSPDLSKAVDITIDGSIWILGSDGTIGKYTKGKPDDFSLKGLDKPFSSPTRIFTTVDLDNVYVLDNGNSRIVVFDKNGNYTAQYQSDALTKAFALDVSEKDKKVYVLSDGKVYEIDLK